MDWDAYWNKVDAQMKAEAARAKQPAERRQQQIPVAEDRRSGLDRRGLRRALEALVGAMPDGCGGDCDQGRRPCNCEKVLDDK